MTPTQLNPYARPPEAEQETPKTAISALILDLAANSAKYISVAQVNPAAARTVEENYLQAVQAARCLFWLTLPFIKDEHIEEFKLMKQAVQAEPELLKVPEKCDLLIDRLAHILKDSGIYELGRPSKVDKLIEDAYPATGGGKNGV